MQIKCQLIFTTEDPRSLTVPIETKYGEYGECLFEGQSMYLARQKIGVVKLSLLIVLLCSIVMVTSLYFSLIHQSLLHISAHVLFTIYIAYQNLRKSLVVGEGYVGLSRKNQQKTYRN